MPSDVAGRGHVRAAELGDQVVVAAAAAERAWHAGRPRAPRSGPCSSSVRGPCAARSRSRSGGTLGGDQADQPVDLVQARHPGSLGFSAVLTRSAASGPP